MKPLADLATVVAAVAAVAALAFGLYQFNETQALTRENLRLQAETLGHERESKAIEFFIKFNELKKELAGKPIGDENDASFWSHNMALALTESVYKLTEGDPGWKKTVLWMLKTQNEWLCRDKPAEK